MVGSVIQSWANRLYFDNWIYCPFLVNRNQKGEGANSGNLVMTSFGNFNITFSIARFWQQDMV
jgi:hypothetical protein